MNQEFQKLIDKRKNWVQANHDNGFDEGISRLLTELYPDNAHFIYELLQNAEDPKATRVHFTLTPTGIRFEHNGKRLFSIKDIESITSIGNSTKRDDATSIGKFGVGFKAVFAYTETPQIHSGEFNIEIRDLVCPNIIDEITTSYDTCFIFPFNNPKKPAATAFKEVKRALLDLNENSLLFLSSIKRISYEIDEPGEERKNGSITLEAIDNHITKVTQKNSTVNDNSTFWLKFEKNKTVLNDKGASINCTLAIAYSLQKKDETNSKKSLESSHPKYEIIPVDRGDVFIYFPAVKETSNLKFHIHAPFASTVARDSVRDCDENNLLRDGLSELIGESLIKIHELKLLNTAFLSVMPNPNDGLSEFYEPILEKINETFHNKTILPMKNGGFTNAINVYSGGKEFSDLIDDDDLVFLTDDGNWAPMWVANPRPQQPRENEFIKSLGVQKWDTENLIEAINSFNDSYDNPDEKRMHFNRWIAQKSDDWLARFYNLLGGYFKPSTNSRNMYRKDLNADKLKFIKINSSKSDESNFTYPTNAYINIEHKSIINSDINVVKIDFYFKQKGSTASYDDIKFLYHQLNLSSFNFEASLKLKIDAMQNTETQFKFDEDRYFEFIEECILFSEQSNSNILIFEGKLLLLAAKPNGEVFWTQAKNIFIDSKFEKTNLKKLPFLADQKRLLSDTYFNKGGFNNDKNYSSRFIDFTKKIGVQFYLSIIDLPLWSNYSNDQIDYTLEGVDYILKNINLDSSTVLWKAIQNLSSDFTKVKNKHSLDRSRATSPSNLVKKLQEEKWLPNIHGVFFQPCEIAWDDLHPELKCKLLNPLQDLSNRYFSEFLKAISFGEKIANRIDSLKLSNELAHKEGFKSFEDKKRRESAARLMSDDQLDDFERAQSIEKNSAFPGESFVANGNQRTNRAVNQAQAAPDREYSSQTRYVNTSRTSVEIKESKTYLRQFYTNDTSQMFCQCCQKELPFRLQSGMGEYYFVDVQITKVTKEHTKYRLALCPTCAAMYRYANDQTDEAIQAKLLACKLDDGAGNAAIDIQLAGKPRQLRFVAKHLSDVRAILKVGV